MSSDMCRRERIRYQGQLGWTHYIHHDYINLRLDSGVNHSIVRPADVEFVTTIDWTQPIELDDGTPLVIRNPNQNELFVDIRCGVAHAHPAFPIGKFVGSARREDGLVISNHKYHVRNRIIMAIPINTDEPLEYVSGTETAVASFITITSEGHILVGRGVGLAESLDWCIFDKAGKFVRSSNGQGTGLTLRNKINKIVRKYKVETTPRGNLQFIECRSFPEGADFEVVTEGDRVVSITPRAGL